MKIIHSSGEYYDLFPDTKIELTRYNPFLNEVGEQSIPISLPATSKNLALLNYPQRGDGKQKPVQRLDAQLQSATYIVKARQAILSARNKGSIETSFYLNEGAFNEKIKDISMQDIFKEKSIVFSNMDEAIDFMHSLIVTTDSRFACFQVLTDKYILNEFSGKRADGFAAFRKEVVTTETIDEKQITIPRGFYITPFPKVKHVLQEILAYFGYTLGPSFLDSMPFSNMCLLNDNIDTIVNNRIDYVDIIPNIMVSTFLDLVRKFNMEIIPNELDKTISIVHFDDMLTSPVVTDLSNNIVSDVTFDYSGEYKQLKLSSEHLRIPAEVYGFSWFNSPRTIQTKQEIESIPLSQIVSSYPTSYVRHEDNAVVRDGVFGDKLITEIVGNLSNSYYDGGVLPAEEKSFSDVIPDVFSFLWDNQIVFMTYPYVGVGRALHSTIVMSDESQTQMSDAGELKPMLCFCYRDDFYKHDIGTLSNYDWTGLRLWDYSLAYNGSDGIFEKFWRRRDSLLRNAMIGMEAEVILSESQKFSISTLRSVMVKGQPYLLSELKYVPGDKDPQTCLLYSTKLQEPISSARTESDYFPERTYKWELKTEKSNTTAKHFIYKTSRTTFYPPHPSQAQYTAGGRYFERIYQVEYGHYDINQNFIKEADGTITVWLEAVPF